MDVTIKRYEPKYLPELVDIWNEVVEDGVAFPQEEYLGLTDGAEFFGSQSYTGVAVNGEGKAVGLYILHPNNIGRCGHICNASYAVASSCRGKHIGELLVKDCLAKGKELGFKILQFNAVVESNTHARHLYRRLGFVQLGVIPGGFRMKDGHYENICPYYHLL
ncbi:MAG: GNAT family N-acetyltransferase [Clostridiales bacterium]|nr:GNAT family N-acetyltransferase [Clostridiales bacterium]